MNRTHLIITTTNVCHLSVWCELKKLEMQSMLLFKTHRMISQKYLNWHGPFAQN